MNYFITRDGQQYGPYTLADLQRYVASGEIALTDLARSEGMSEPLPVSRVIGTIAVPQTQARPVMANPYYPDPPNLHWALVLLFGIFTCGLFNLVWALVLAEWMRKVAPQSKAIFYYIAAAGSLVALCAVSFIAARVHAPSPLAEIFNFAYAVLLLVGRFSLRASLEQHYNSVEAIGLSLSGVMTFFFGDIYFQYHINAIQRVKNAARMGVLPA